MYQRLSVRTYLTFVEVSNEYETLLMHISVVINFTSCKSWGLG